VAASLGTTGREKTVDDTCRHCGVHVMCTPRGSAEALDDLHNDVQLWVDSRLKEGASAAQIIKGYRVLRMVLGRGRVKAGWIRTNPCASYLSFPECNCGDAHLNTEEVEASPRRLLTGSHEQVRRQPQPPARTSLCMCGSGVHRSSERGAVRAAGQAPRPQRRSRQRARGVLDGRRRLITGAPKQPQGHASLDCRTSSSQTFAILGARLFNPRVRLRRRARRSSATTTSTDASGRRVRAADCPLVCGSMIYAHVCQLLVRAGVHVKR